MIKLKIKFYKLVELLIFCLWNKKIYFIGFLFSSFFKNFFFPNKLLPTYFNSLDSLLDQIKKSFSSKKYVPRFKNLSSEIYNKKILLLFPTYSQLSWFEVFKKKFKSCLILDISKVSYKDKLNIKNYNNADNLKLFHEHLIHKIIKFNPDLIVLDVNYSPNKFTINSNTIKFIRNIYKKKIIGFIGDFYKSEHIDIANRWANFIDFVYYGNESINEKNFKLKKNIKFLPYTCDSDIFYPSKKSIKFFFSGIGNILRFDYLFFIKHKNLFLNSLVNIHVSNKKQSMSYKLYVSTMRKSKMTINFSRRGKDIYHCGGNRLEAFASKTLLINESNTLKNSFFTPFVNYIPFNSTIELSIINDFIKLHPEIIKKMTDDSYDTFQNYYSFDAIIFYLSKDKIF